MNQHRAAPSQGRPDSARTLTGYLAEVASAAPAPGGGSVAAIAGALAAALATMVAHLSIGRARDPEADARLQEAADRLEALREALAQAAEADERSYAAFRAASALPRRAEDEKRVRKEAMQEALSIASDVPLGIAEAATETAEILVDVVRHGNPRLRADAALSALLAEAALRGGLLLLRGNAAMLEDDARAASYLAQAEQLEARGRAAAQSAYQGAAGAG